MPLLTRREALATAAGLLVAVPVLAEAKPKTAKVEFRRAETAAADGLTEATVAGTTDKVYLHKEADLTAEDVKSATVGGDDTAVAVEITFTDAGAKKAAKLAEAHADKPVAIVVDGKALAAPVVRAKFGSKVVITGKFTKAEAETLAKALGGT